MVQTLCQAISVDKAQIDKTDYHVSSTLTDQLREYLSRFWLFIARTNLNKQASFELTQALSELAELTPANVINEEYLQI